MSVYKRDNHWWIYVRVFGTRVRRSAGKGATRADAQALEAKVRAQLRSGRSPTRHTIEEAILRWLNGDARSLRSYQSTVDHVHALRPFLGDRWLDQAPDAAEDAKQAWLADGKAPATINRRLAIMRRVLNLAYKWGWTEQPMAPKVQLLAVKNQRHVYLTPEQVEELANAAGEAGETILLLAYTGLRVGELWLARKSDGHVILPPKTKSGHPRIVPLPSQVEHVPIPPLITRQQFRTRFERAREAVGKPGVRPHDLRHTYASWLVQTGAALPTVRDLLGHSDVSVTGRYSHLGSEHLQAAVRKLR